MNQSHCTFIILKHPFFNKPVQSFAHFHCSIFCPPTLTLPLLLFLYLSAALFFSFLHLYRAGVNCMIPLLPSLPDVTLLQHKQPQPPTHHYYSALSCMVTITSILKYSINLLHLSQCFPTTSSVACCCLVNDEDVTWLRATPMQLPILYSMSS